jgi:hypothetical protein
MNDIKWGHDAKVLNVFISSPDDVREERTIVNEVLAEINRGIGNRLRITLLPRMWENFTPTAGDPMNAIRRQLATCDLFLMIFSRTFGTSVLSPNGEYKSGTESEYEAALGLRSEQGVPKPEIHAYFKRVSDSETLKDPGPKLREVLNFKERVQSTLFYKEYSSTESFRPLVKDNITEWLCDLAPTLTSDKSKERKYEVLRKFFDLGTVGGKPLPARIIYPPMDINCHPQKDITHLLPYMVLEDFQAINKLSKNLASAGYEHVKAVSEDVFKHQTDDRYVNKILLCLPRNTTAQKLLKAFPQSRFQIHRITESVGTNRRDVHFIHWTLKDGAKVKVCSPQSKYLWLQRKKQPEQWMQHAGACHAVDFAVLAKFRDKPHDDLAQASELKTFFIFGCRGLGTWGATWYIDHQYEDLLSHSSSPESHQQLLRVEFSGNKVIKVEDVSDKPQEYFDEQNDISRIKKAYDPS